MNVRRFTLSLLASTALAVSFAGPAAAKSDDGNWEKIRHSLFKGATINVDDKGEVIKLETPVRAMDASIVPVAIRSQIEQTKDRYIKKIWLVVDKNPSPVGATFTLTPRSGRADIETRIRIEEYTNVRAVAQLNDDSLYVATNYVKASGGCSAPAGKDLAAALANMGKMRLRVDGKPEKGKPVLAQLMVSHPNVTGLAMDQVSRMYAPPHFVRHVQVSYGNEVVMEAEVDFSISENPNFRFWFTPDGNGELMAQVIDTEDKKFSKKISVKTSAPTH